MEKNIGPPRNKKRSFLTTLNKHKHKYVMLAPAVIMIFIFNYIPLWGWLMAFKAYRVGKGLMSSEWVGLTNFKKFFTMGNDYAYLLRNTLVINIVQMLLAIGCAMLFAILLNELRNRIYMKTVQTVSFFPFFISWVIVYAIVNAFLAIDSGAVNQTLVKLGIIEKGINFLASKDYAWGLTWFLMLWKYIGYNSVIYLAAITGISPELYESASIDGAGRFQKVLFITLPHLAPTMIVILIIQSGTLLRSGLDYFWLFTNPHNWQKMEVLDMYIYRFGLQNGNFSYATAVGILLTTVSLTLVLGTNALSRKLTDKSIL